MSTSSAGRKPIILQKIVDIICDLSGMEAEDVGVNESFLELGFDSLFMTQLAGSFQKHFAIEITFRQLMRELGSSVLLGEFLDTHLPADVCQAPPDVPAQALESEADEAKKIVDSPPNMGALMTQMAVPGSAGGISASVQSILAEQLKLMSLQLSMLQGAAAPPSAEGNTGLISSKAVAPAQADTVEVKEIIKLPPGFGPQVENATQKRSLGEKQVYLDALIAAYNKQTAKSKESTQYYRYHHADPRTAAGFNPLWKELVYPLVIERSKGARLWDIDGNEYIDLLNGFGPNFLGHAPDFVQAALHRQVDQGFEIGPQTPLAGEVAKIICEMTGNDRATFVNTGSEAVQAVMRVARTVTGKDKVVVFRQDYHGNFDEVLVRGSNVKQKLRTLPLAPGIPRPSVENILVLEYGDEDGLAIISDLAHEIAAVLIEPVQSRRPEFRPVEFVKKLRSLTQEKNIAFVFDEVITGFRTGFGGAQEYYGVKADLVTYGKVLGGGMPIGVVAGSAKYMNTFDGGPWQYGDDSFPEAGVTFFAGTFLRHPLAIAAAHASLTYLREQGPGLYLEVYEKTTLLANRLNRLFEVNDIGIHVAHFSSQMYFRIQDENELIELLFYNARLRGLFMLEGFPSYMTLSHTYEDIDRIVQVFNESIQSMQKGGILAVPASRSTEKFPLTQAQMEVWTASQFSPVTSCAYNESDTVRLLGDLDIGKLEFAVKAVFNRHQALNLRIDAGGQEQFVDWGQENALQHLDLSDYTEKGASEKLEEFYENQATTPFDLDNGPLVCVHLVTLTNSVHLLVIYGHHIAFDGWSSSIVLHEIARIYSALVDASDLVLPKAMGFNDYVQEASALAQSDKAKADLEYWQARYQNEVPRHNLPTDYKRGASRSYEGDTLHHEYDGALLVEIRRAAAQAGVTIHNFLLAGFTVFLHHKSRDKEIVIGVPTAGQMLASNDCLVGYCVNLLPMKQELNSQQSVKNLLLAVRENVLDTFDHQACSFSQLLNSLPVNREAARSPLVELVFNYSSYFNELEFSGLQASVYENARRAVIFDMFLNIVEMEDSLHVDWDFNSSLFSFDTLEQWVIELGDVYSWMVKNPEKLIGQYEDKPAGN